MYYTKQDSTNSNYYNTYKNSAYQYSNGTAYLTFILKILLILLLLGILFVGYIYISNQIKPITPELTIVKKVDTFKVFEENSPIETKNISTENLIKEIKTVEKQEFATGQVNLTQDDIANIVQIVMSKINRPQAEVMSDDDYTKELLSQEVDGLGDNIKQVAKHSVILKDTNHYNKVVINQPKDEKYTNDRLSQLSAELSSAIDNNSSSKPNSSYTKEIEKEITVRSNEMRIIVVEEGDTLSSISYKAYGNSNAYVKIYEANPEIIQNPDQIFVGQRLRIPI